MVLALATWGCGNSSGPNAVVDSPRSAHVKITRFYPEPKKIARGLKGKICYGVENGVRLELTPSVETLLPSVMRCFEVAPTANTTYTLTAYGQDGSRESKAAELAVGAPPPKLYDLRANSTYVARGKQVKICFKVDNATSVKVHPGKLDATGRCMTDRPSKSTEYKITALGGDREIDTGTVNVKVH